MALSINELKTGVTIEFDNAVYLIVEVQHVKPGKGAAFARVKIRNLKLGTVQEKTFRDNEKIEEAFVEERKLQYLYHQDDLYHFMDQQTYEEMVISKNDIVEQSKFLKDNLEVNGYYYNNNLINIQLPNFVVYSIVRTEPGIKGDTAKATTKPAELESGATVLVPLFINEGESIKIDTRTGEYIERVV